MTFINLAPDARGVENMARAFREQIDRTRLKIARIEELCLRVNGDEGGEGDYYFMLGGRDGLDDFDEGMGLLIQQEEKRITSLQEGLDACQLAIEANRVLALLRKGQEYLPENYPSSVDDVIAIIVKLAGKAGMKG